MASGPDPQRPVVLEDDEDVDMAKEAEAREKDRDEGLKALEELRELGVEITADESDAQEEGGFSVDEARIILDKIERVVANLDMTDPIIRGQWSRHLGKYTLVGDTIDKLPVGYYDLEIDNAGNIWFSPIRARTDELLRFPDAATDKILAEIETFWDREATFKKYGLPFKRGILLWGPPGSGKTSTLQLLARDVVKREGLVLIFKPELFMAAYRQIRRIQPETPIVVLMEDLDATIKRHDESVVLNILDGADVIDRTVFVATTNYPEELGERIINRPSRFDRRLFIGDPSPVARKMYLEAMIKGRRRVPKMDIDKMVRDTEGMSLAHVKELFVAHVVIGSPYDEALSNLKEQHMEKPHSVHDRDKHGDLKRGQYI